MSNRRTKIGTGQPSEISRGGGWLFFVLSLVICVIVGKVLWDNSTSHELPVFSLGSFYSFSNDVRTLIPHLSITGSLMAIALLALALTLGFAIIFNRKH